MTAKDIHSGLTAERLREVVTYDPLTGIFRWRVTRGCAKAGAVAGGPEKKGYLRISIDGRRFKAHRLAWLYVKGCWPVDQIDHENGRNADNRFDNLREANNPLNSANAAIPKTRASPDQAAASPPASRKTIEEFTLDHSARPKRPPPHMTPRRKSYGAILPGQTKGKHNEQNSNSGQAAE